jgi:integrase
LFNHIENYKSWKKDLTSKYIEEGLTKENSKLFLQYLSDMEKGLNVSNKNKKGGRDIKTLNRLRNKVRQILKMLQDSGVKDITKISEEKAVSFFADWREQGHSSDYAKRFKAFWHWYMKVNRKKGIAIPDITEEIDISDSKTKFVWMSKDAFDNFRNYFNEEEQLILLFCYDSIIRSPTELISLKVENVFIKGKEIWIDIPDDVSKTFGRKFNLVYCGEELIKYTEGKKSEDYLFDFSPVYMNRKMQKGAEQIFGDKKSLGGDYFKNITMYDLRHSGAIHFRQLFQKTGQSLDSLRHRGGWTDFKMINYYTQMLGLDGHIDKEKTLLQEDKTQMEKDIIKLKEREKEFVKKMAYIEELIKKKQNKIKAIA